MELTREETEFRASTQPTRTSPVEDRHERIAA